jgi:hypothetical protein
MSVGLVIENRGLSMEQPPCLGLIYTTDEKDTSGGRR